MDRNIEIYDEETKVIKRIEELKERGFKETDMYIMTDDDNDVAILRGMTGVIIKEDDDSLWDRFKSFLSRKDSVIDAFNRMKIDEEDRDFYYEQVQSGKILLYVDKEYIQYYNLHEDGKFRPIVPPEASHDPDQEDVENMSEEAPKDIKEEFGLDNQPPSPEERRDKAKIDFLIEEERNRFK